MKPHHPTSPQSWSLPRSCDFRIVEAAHDLFRLVRQRAVLGNHLLLFHPHFLDFEVTRETKVLTFISPWLSLSNRSPKKELKYGTAKPSFPHEHTALSPGYEVRAEAVLSGQHVRLDSLQGTPTHRLHSSSFRDYLRGF